jgi:hypothetical protein
MAGRAQGDFRSEWLDDNKCEWRMGVYAERRMDGKKLRLGEIVLIGSIDSTLTIRIE